MLFSQQQNKKRILQTNFKNNQLNSPKKHNYKKSINNITGKKNQSLHIKKALFIQQLFNNQNVEM